MSECTKHEVFSILYIQIYQYSNLKSYSFRLTVNLDLGLRSNVSAVRFAKLKVISESIAFSFRDSIHQRKISIFVLSLSSFIGLILSMLRCTLQANGLGLLGFRLASLPSLLILDQAGTPVDVNDTLHQKF